MTASLPSESEAPTPEAPSALRVLYVWDADYPWDVRTEKVCLALQTDGHRVRLVARNQRRQPLHEVRPEATVRRMPAWRFVGARLDSLLSFPAFFNPRWISHLIAAIREVRPQVIIVRDIPLCPLALALGRMHRIPVVLDMAENYGAMMQELWETGRQRPFDFLIRNPRVVRAIERYCVRRVDEVLVVVEESGERLVALGVDRSHIHVVSNTPPRGRVRERVKNGRHGALRLVYLGLLEMHRGVGELLEAFALVRSRGLDVTLRIIGSGRDERILRERAHTLGLDDDVEFLGYVRNADALAMLDEADVGVVPHRADESWNSTISNKLFDYMASGVAVITTDAVPSARVVRESGAGIVCRSGDPASMSDAIAECADERRRHEFARAGQDAVLTRFHWERDARILCQVVRLVTRIAHCV